MRTLDPLGDNRKAYNRAMENPPPNGEERSWDRRLLDRISRDSYPGHAKESGATWPVALLHAPLIWFTAATTGASFLLSLLIVGALIQPARYVWRRACDKRARRRLAGARPNPFGG